jgi:site-specific recombinase XerD
MRKIEPAKNDRLENVYLALTLDTRRAKQAYPLLPVAVRVNYCRNTYYYRTGYKCNLAEWERFIRASGRGAQKQSAIWQVKEAQIAIYERVKAEVNSLNQSGSFTLESLKQRISGKSKSTFTALWRSIIDSADKHNTAYSYMTAFKSFHRFVNKGNEEREIPFSRIGVEVVEKWFEWLYNNGISDTTIAIYSRSLRVAINKAIRENMIKDVQMPFGSEKEGKVAIPDGNRRRGDFISIDKINTLRSFVCPDEWSQVQKGAVMRSVDMFVFSYLAGGMNFRDIALLTWDSYYFRHGELRYVRSKTSGRKREAIETLIPIIPEIRAILQRHGSDPVEGERVFPWILYGATSGQDISRRVQQLNQNVRKHLIKVCKSLGWVERISPTWARHSFKSNAEHLGIPSKYIELAMAHSIAGVEGHYMGNFPPEEQKRYAQQLISGKKSLDVSLLTDEEKKQLLNELLNSIK